MGPQLTQAGPALGETGDVTSRLTHDAAAILRHIGLYADMAEEELASPELARGHIAIIRTKALTLSRLLVAARTLLAVQSLPLLPQSMDGRRLVGESLQAAVGLKRFNVDLTGEALVRGDPTLTRLTLRTVLDAAALHGAAEGGALHIALDPSAGPRIDVIFPATVQAEECHFDGLTPWEMRPSETVFDTSLFIVRQAMMRQGGTAHPLGSAVEGFGVRLEFAKARGEASA